MWKQVSGALALVAILAVASTSAVAQNEPPPTAEELTLRPGDTIRWTPGPAHEVQFGGGALTPFSTVQSILNLPSTLTPDANGVALAGQGTVLNATVKATAAPGATFNFTCGIHNEMVALPFKVEAAAAGQAPRNVQIVTASNPLRWILRIDRRLSQ
jgi:plastocyanin